MERALDPRDYGSFGVGCWAIGGPWDSAEGTPLGWGAVDDAESIAAIRRALDLGVRIFDTADTYGAGHSERILARGLRGHRDEVLIVSKFGNTFDEAAKQRTGTDVSPEYIRRATEDSLRRLDTDRIDIHLLHVADVDPGLVPDVIGALETLVADGLIRSYGWSTDDVERARLFAAQPNCAALEIQLNVLSDAPEMLVLLEEQQLPALVRSPLAMGLLAGRVQRDTTLATNDVRGIAPAWQTWFRDSRPAPEFLGQVDTIRGILTRDGRTIAQGALAWLWARSHWVIPIPGFRTPSQVEQNAAARDRGPLTTDQMARIEAALSR